MALNNWVLFSMGLNLNLYMPRVYQEVRVMSGVDQVDKLIQGQDQLLRLVDYVRNFLGNLITRPHCVNLNVERIWSIVLKPIAVGPSPPVSVADNNNKYLEMSLLGKIIAKYVFS
mgnify:CR=1 FL=1